MTRRYLLIVERTHLTCSVLTSDDLEWVREMAGKAREKPESREKPVTRIRIIEVARVIDDWKPTAKGL